MSVGRWMGDGWVGGSVGGSVNGWVDGRVGRWAGGCIGEGWSAGCCALWEFNDHHVWVFCVREYKFCSCLGPDFYRVVLSCLGPLLASFGRVDPRVNFRFNRLGPVLCPQDRLGPQLK